jgi:hypothetical protein
MLTPVLIVAAVLAIAEPATVPATTPADELVHGYVAAVDAAQKRFADDVARARKTRNEQTSKAEKAFAVEKDLATEKYVATAEKAMARYAEARKVAIAATIAAYDGQIERLKRRKLAAEAAAATAARDEFVARARRENDEAAALARASSGVSIGASGEPVATTTTAPAGERGPVIADHIVAAVDDFIIDIYLNGEKVPDASRKLLAEVHGATVEQIDVEIRRGDWIVFNVVSNRMRWDGASLFIAAARLNEGGEAVFATHVDHKQWSVCDDPAEVKKFIADPAHLADRPAKPPTNPWGEGIGRLNDIVPNSQAEPIWGESRNTWIKFVAE